VKKCIKCNKLKVETQFYKNGERRKDGTSGTKNTCKQCSDKIHSEYVKDNISKVREYSRNSYNPEKVRKQHLKRYYGLESKQYDDLFLKQNGSCAICGTHQKDIKMALNVDHNHNTGEVRGLLCHSCNRGIGLLKDSKDILKNAIGYLEKCKN